MRPALALAGVLLLSVIMSAQQETSAALARVSPFAPIRIVLDGARKIGDCVAERKLLQGELANLPFPPGWTLAIMCTPVRWATIFQQVSPPYTRDAFTRISERITVFNGAVFREFPSRHRHIMAHELAHVRCGCADENQVEGLAYMLERAHSSAASKDLADAKLDDASDLQRQR